MVEGWGMHSGARCEEARVAKKGIYLKPGRAHGDKSGGCVCVCVCTTCARTGECVKRREGEGHIACTRTVLLLLLLRLALDLLGGLRQEHNIIVV